MRARFKLLISAAWTGAWTESTTSDGSSKALPGKVTRSEFISTPHEKSYRSDDTLAGSSRSANLRHGILLTRRAVRTQRSFDRLKQKRFVCHRMDNVRAVHTGTCRSN